MYIENPPHPNNEMMQAAVTAVNSAMNHMKGMKGMMKTKSGFHSSPEPEPEFNSMTLSEWGAWWPLHVYLFALLFLFLACYNVNSIAGLMVTRKPLKKKMLFVFANVMLCSFSTVTSLQLFIDPYGSDMHKLHLMLDGVYFLVFGMKIPCLTSAFSFIYIALIETSKVKLYSRKLHNIKYFTGIVVLHFAVSLAVHIFLIYNQDKFELVIICLSFFLIFSIAISFLFLFNYIKIKRLIGGDSAPVQSTIHINRSPRHKGKHFTLSTNMDGMDGSFTDYPIVKSVTALPVVVKSVKLEELGVVNPVIEFDEESVCTKNVESEPDSVTHNTSSKAVTKPVKQDSLSQDTGLVNYGIEDDISLETVNNPLAIPTVTCEDEITNIDNDNDNNIDADCNTNEENSKKSDKSNDNSDDDDVAATISENDGKKDATDSNVDIPKHSDEDEDEDEDDDNVAGNDIGDTIETETNKEEVNENNSDTGESSESENRRDSDNNTDNPVTSADVITLPPVNTVGGYESASKDEKRVEETECHSMSLRDSKCDVTIRVDEVPNTENGEINRDISYRGFIMQTFGNNNSNCHESLTIETPASTNPNEPTDLNRKAAATNGNELALPVITTNVRGSLSKLPACVDSKQNEPFSQVESSFALPQGGATPRPPVTPKTTREKTTLQRKRPAFVDKSLNKLLKLVTVVSLSSFLYCAAIMYYIVLVLTHTKDLQTGVWPWFAYQTVARIAEFGMTGTMSYLVRRSILPSCTKKGKNT